MYWLLTDETNKPPRADQFFIYGGLMLDSAVAGAVDAAVSDVRREYGYAQDASFKFSVGGSGLDAETHEAAKLALLDRLPELGLKFVATVVHYRIKGDAHINAVIELAINTLTMAYWEFLGDERRQGIMLIDRVDTARGHDEFRNFARRFTEGLQFDQRSRRVDDRILLFGMTNNNSSRLSSAVDIAIGAFRTCVNASTTNSADDGTAATYWRRLDPLVWRRNGRRTAGGFRPRPVDVRAPSIRRVYDKLEADLRSWSE
ncbi:hypothetical protein [Microbacterium sp. 1262]|uniref:hypothetical protein n=1 Tax=Microbacterium sp. 1262 TaxID=3156415 RepID=UPI0033936CB3